MARRRRGGNAVKVEGLRELQRDLRRAGDKDLQRELRKAGKEAGESAKDDARTFLARNHSISGRLERSVGIQVSQSGVRIKMGTPSMDYHGPFAGGWRSKAPRPVLGVAAAKTKKERAEAYEKAIERVTKALRRRR